MLTKKDISSIKSMMIDTLGEFFETIMVPYLDHEHKENQKEHEEIRVQLGHKIDLINEHLKDHGKRISRLEDIVNVS